MARIVTVTLNPALDLNLTLDHLATGAVNRAREADLIAAGKGMNVARVLAALGHSVVATGLLGADNAEPFEQACRTHGLAERFVRVPGQTRTNVKVADAGGAVTEINGPGFHPPADALAHLEHTLATVLPGCDALVLAGSLPPGVPADAVASLVHQGAAAGVPVWLDTSGAALARGLSAQPFGIKPNREELAEWLGRPPADPDLIPEAIRQCRDLGIAHGVFSLGGDGVIWCTADAVCASTPPPVPVANTVCAGDTLLAGMVHGALTWPGSPEQALTYATALAAECVRHPGVGNPKAEDLPALVAQTRVGHRPLNRTRETDTGNKKTGEMPS